MTDEFIRKGLTTSVAQICSNIGWHSMSNSTLQMMTDILYEYFRDLAQSVKKFSEICEYLFAYAIKTITLNVKYVLIHNLLYIYTESFFIYW